MKLTSAERSARWRKKHPESSRRAQEKHYSSGVQPEDATKTPWNEEDLKLLRSWTNTDRELSLKLKRTINAIRQKRHSIRHNQ